MAQRGSVHLSWAALAAAAILAMPACVEVEAAAEGSFQRTVTVSGEPEIDVSTGSGSIEVRPGTDGRVEITGQIRAGEGWGFGSSLSAEERVRRIEAEPPIQQSGNLVRIGHIADDRLRRGVSISYVFRVPVGSRVKSRTGSGSQNIEGVSGPVDAESGSGSLTLTRLGGSARGSTGSGSIEADDIGGALTVSTGSGSIRAGGVNGAIHARTGSGGVDITQTGQGDVDAQSGSGTVHLRGIRGGLRASTGSGGIHVDGELAGDWRLSASSGSIHVDLPPGQGFELDATTGSGSIDVGPPITTSGNVDRRHVQGTVGGGGPLLHVRTSSGGVQIRQ